MPRASTSESAYASLSGSKNVSAIESASKNVGASQSANDCTKHRSACKITKYRL